MIREDIYFMAKQAGIDIVKQHDSDTPSLELLIRFAKLVAEHEREEIAQFIERTELGSLPDETALQYAKLLKSYSSSIRARREA